MQLDEAVRVARALMDEHGLAGWRLVLDSAKTRAGVCRAHRREIGLSRHLTVLHPAAEVRDTVLHEIAHALVGPQHGHDAVWRATAVRIGGSGNRKVSRDAPRVEGDWVGVCPSGHRSSAHRRPTRVKSCARCSSTFDVVNLLTWTHRGEQVAMHPSYATELSRLVRRAAGPPASEDDTSSPGVGDLVRLRTAGRFDGAVGRIQSRGRTRFRVALDHGVVTAPFGVVERV